jgi:hypothetical protein
MTATKMVALTGAAAMIESLSALTRTDLFPRVRTALKTGTASLEALCPAGRFIAAAISAGWFLLPAGHGYSYSKAQFFSVLGLFARTPWALDLKTFAAAKTAELNLQVSPRHRDSLWTHPQGLASFTRLGQSTPVRRPRMPHEWSSGAITVELVHQCLIDSFNACERDRFVMASLMSHGVLLEGCPLSRQIDVMKSIGEQYQIPALLMSTRRMFLDRHDREALRAALLRPDSGTEFERHLAARKIDAAESSRRAWRDVYARIHHVAAVMTDFGASEHQGTINRRLRECAGPTYRMEATGTTGDQLILSLGNDYYAGRHVNIGSHWLFRNWVMALSERLMDAETSYESYMQAERDALEGIDLTGEQAQQGKRWRPYDDFEDETIRRVHVPNRAA